MIVLSKQEKQALVLLCDGLTDKQIGEAIQRSPETVKRYGISMRNKTGMDNRVMLAMWAVRNGYVKVAND